MNRFELTGINKDYIEHLDEPRLMQFYAVKSSSLSIPKIFPN